MDEHLEPLEPEGNPASGRQERAGVEPTRAVDLRASDSERERAVTLLREAVSDGRLDVDELEERVQAAYRVRTRRELESLIDDVSPIGLVDHGPLSGPALASGAVVHGGPAGSRWVVSIMSGHERRGRWHIASRCTVLNVMGSCDLDLNDAELSGPVTELRVYSIMGGGEIRVPDGVDVRVSNIAIMGGNDIRLGEESTPPGAPLIQIRLVSIMGGCAVKRGRKLSKDQRRSDKELRKGGTQA